MGARIPTCLRAKKQVTSKKKKSSSNVTTTIKQSLPAGEPSSCEEVKYLAIILITETLYWAFSLCQAGSSILHGWNPLMLTALEKVALFLIPHWLTKRRHRRLSFLPKVHTFMVSTNICLLCSAHCFGCRRYSSEQKKWESLFLWSLRISGRRKILSKKWQLGPPSCSSVSDIAFQCRRCGFDPWSGS